MKAWVSTQRRVANDIDRGNKNKKENGPVPPGPALSPDGLQGVSIGRPDLWQRVGGADGDEV